MKGTFSQKDLVPWQYQIRHLKPSAFKRGEKVFLKSNPELELTVVQRGVYQVTVEWRTMEETQRTTFPPECILQYKYAALQTWKQEFNICLN